MPTSPSSRARTGHVAVVLAAAALFCSVDGPSTAAGLLTGKDVKNSSLTGKDVKADSLSGADLREDTLTKVPTAATADQAATATSVSANSVTGAGVADGSLSAEDYALFSGTVTVDIPNVPADDCAYSLIPAGVDLTGAVVAVSAGDSGTWSSDGLSIHAAKSNVVTSFRLVACNLTAADKNPGPADFDVLAVK